MRLGLNFKIKLPYLVKLFFFWIGFFFFFRLFFFLYHYDKFPANHFSETLAALFYGLRLDISIISYMLVLPFLLWLLRQFFNQKVIYRISEWYQIFLIIVFTFLSFANIRMYGEWGTLLNYRALGYLLYPEGVVASVPVLSLIIMMIVCVVIAFVAIVIYEKAVINFSYLYEGAVKKTLVGAILLIMLIIGVRGGVQQTPVNESAVYKSNHIIVNHLATNSVWYVVHSLLDAKGEKNPYEFMDQPIAEKRLNELLKKSGSTEKILNADKPNVVFIILESWSADLIKTLGGEENATPCFDTLQKEGLLFTRAYASGNRTDQGIVSILSGYPSQPNLSILNVPSKAEKLKSINSYFLSEGYNSSFYYGGEIEFANMKTYLVNSRFQKIIDIEGFEKKQLNSKWGAHDEYVLEKQLHDLEKENQPFFSVLLTLSTHEPFEVPISQTPFMGKGESDQFNRAAYYTDYCLGNYFRQAKKQPWFSKTLFVLVSDHGHRLPMNRDMNMPESRKIAMLFLGGALKEEYKGKKIDHVVAQNDIAATLLSQFDVDTDAFFWSKNIFSSEPKQFVYYANESVLGWISTPGSIVYSHVSKQLVFDNTSAEANKDSLLLDARAYLQCIYRDYLDK